MNTVALTIQFFYDLLILLFMLIIAISTSATQKWTRKNQDEIKSIKMAVNGIYTDIAHSEDKEQHPRKEERAPRDPWTER